MGDNLFVYCLLLCYGGRMMDNTYGTMEVMVLACFL